MDTFTKELIDTLNENSASDKTKLSLWYIYKMIGKDKCLEIVEQARKAFEAGEMIADGSRQRTLGGCFFHRLPNDVSYDAYKKADNTIKILTQKTQRLA